MAIYYLTFRGVHSHNNYSIRFDSYSEAHFFSMCFKTVNKCNNLGWEKMKVVKEYSKLEIMREREDIKRYVNNKIKNFLNC